MKYFICYKETTEDAGYTIRYPESIEQAVRVVNELTESGVSLDQIVIIKGEQIIPKVIFT